MVCIHHVQFPEYFHHKIKSKGKTPDPNLHYSILISAILLMLLSRLIRKQFDHEGDERAKKRDQVEIELTSLDIIKKTRSQLEDHLSQKQIKNDQKDSPSRLL
ncbi:UNKNOWN [Stylonychia lemnae]|uniref:Uncharacterized protein n=1 Tax=Stylonychia lemnae TaxID=5949 RepID=A0A078AHK2_STYLE|nr:UNKNOWN [Stylonychia lemnae]|eukprot:CDW81346.1 UNKNOWN [Stylonychia lemnae]